MADVEHVDIIDGERHEPKGADSANAGAVYVSDGAQSGSWRRIPHGALYYDDIGTGTTLTTPTIYTLVGPATVGDADPREFTHNSLGRLTYTGDANIDMNAAASITFKHSSATLVDVFFQFHVNGVPVAGAQHASAALSGNYQHVSLTSHFPLVNGDYVEVFALTASGDVIVHAISVDLHGKI